METKEFTIALAGNPNCGKTALFNALTGSRQHVGNWSGVTVEKKEGFFNFNGKKIRVVDLPGTYALFANGEDERAAVEYLLSREADLIINIVDATNIERNMFLTSQLSDMQLPMIIAVNMMDIAEARGLKLDLKKLSNEIGVSCYALSAVKESSITNFTKELCALLSHKINVPKIVPYSEKLEAAIAELLPKIEPVANHLKANARFISLMYLGSEKSFADKFKTASVNIDRKNIEAIIGEDSEFAIAEARYARAKSITKSVIVANSAKKTVSDYVDAIVLNRFVALPIFLVVMYLVFWISVTFGSAFIEFFDIFFGAIFVDGFAYLLSNVLHAPDFTVAILANGIGAGIKTVSTFIPVIFFIFFSLSFLEDSGYMARGAFVADRFMRFLGLPGRAFVPMMVGFGCSVPGIMGSRVLESKRERFMTIFLVPFMSCGARLPVYALFSAAFFGMNAGIIVFALYIFGVLFAAGYGLLLRHSLFKGEASNFVMELPPYHMPRPKALFTHSWLKLRDYITRAGKVITIAVALLGFLNSFNVSVQDQSSVSGEVSKQSLLCIIGKAITPAFEPFGIEKDNWPASVSLLTGVFAKEAVIGTINSLYSMTTEETSISVDIIGSTIEALKTIPKNLAYAVGIKEYFWAEENNNNTENAVIYANLNSNFHNPDKYGNHVAGFNWQVFAFLVFILLYMPCVATMGVVVKEIGTKLAALMGAVQTMLAWSVAVLLYQVPVGKNILWIVVSLLMFVAITIFLKLFGKKINCNE